MVQKSQKEAKKLKDKNWFLFLGKEKTLLHQSVLFLQINSKVPACRNLRFQVLKNLSLQKKNRNNSIKQSYKGYLICANHCT